MILAAKTTLDDCLDYISQSHPEDIELGLERVRDVYAALGLERRCKRIVLVAGTNGKGSTVAMIEAGMEALGFSTGSYTSPHIRRYNERVRLRGEPVSDEALVSSFQQVERARGAVPLTYFEFGTLAALALLEPRELDVLILEIGLGGRLDAVNIADPDISVITSISLDHTDWLGDTLDAIGREKAGILREGRPAVLGEDMPASVFEVAETLGCPVFQYGNNLEWSGDGAGLKTPYGEIACARPAMLSVPLNNLALAVTACDWLYRDLSRTRPAPDAWSAVSTCFGQLSFPGRLERVSDTPPVYLDVGHNPHAASFLARFLAEQKAGSDMPVYAVYSSLADKDANGVVQALGAVVDFWYVAELDVPRAMSKAHLMNAVGQQTENVLSFPNLENALKTAIHSAEKDNAILLIFGSFYVVEEAHSLLRCYD